MKWRAFPLHPEIPEEGLLLRDLFADYSTVDIEKIRNRLRETAADLGLPLRDRDKTFNSRRAQELGLWAGSTRRGDAFHNAVFRAYFVDGKNIARIDVLTGLAASVGLSPDEARDVLLTGAYSAAVDSDWALSREKGVTAVPTFILENARLVGAQPYPVLADFLEMQGVDRSQ
ncbi:MAG: DsbA family protein [Syntrophales bacterium]|jgi:predicted DsbA family dithiol-disulfide isomerase|nr:DsbA family protein [Syntrophales bacterium]